VREGQCEGYDRDKSLGAERSVKISDSLEQESACAVLHALWREARPIEIL